ncbi:DegV family protein [Nocardioides limicola]|uniref:DegV family protein n=1 Tax=Nocardioides limicola TaxID=2803368 RepID=UPI00193C33E5|nr:DegV family protein [Nocardioides sp. DJM-14]
MVRSIALVTDSTASLPAEVAEAREIHVVPLQVVIGATAYDEGGTDGATPDRVAEALRERAPVSTSRPAPATFAQCYAELAAAGATEIVSVHLSAEMSGTYESACLAAKDAPVPVTVVDSRQVGISTGYGVLAAADVLDAGGSAADAATAARERCAATTSLFYVDTLEYLRRGGRVGAAAALLGSALAVKPLLAIDEGKVVPREKVRTATKALARLVDLAVEAADEHQVEVTVAHLANLDRAEQLSEALHERLEDNLAGRQIDCGEVGAVLAAHVGPGMVAVSVAPLLD